MNERELKYLTKAKNELHLDERLSVPIKDKESPSSVINVAPGVITTALESIPDTVFQLSTDELRDAFRKTKYDEFTEVEEKLRISFWKEYDSAVSDRRKMSIQAVCSGVCQVPFFKKHIVGNSFRLAYILTPPADYVLTIEELLKLSLEQTREILLLPHFDKKGEVNARVADLKLKALDIMLLRSKGAVAQRIESKNLNLNVETDARKTESLPTSVEDIDAKLQELRRKALGVDEPIDVTPKS